MLETDPIAIEASSCHERTIFQEIGVFMNVCKPGLRRQGYLTRLSVI